jgi:hypothetical protein
MAIVVLAVLEQSEEGGEGRRTPPGMGRGGSHS